MKSVREIILNNFEGLKHRHKINCNLTEEVLEEGYLMVFDSDKNNIIFDCRRIQESFQQGSEYGILNYDISTYILFCLMHEIGHYYDCLENPSAFNIGSKEEYIQMELRGIQKAKRICPPELIHDFNKFNDLIIDCYRIDLAE